MAVEAIRKRRSVRKFQDTEVTESQLNQVLDTLRYAPSWANKQGWQVMVIREQNTRGRISGALEGNPGAKAVLQAPVLLVVCMDPTASGMLDDRAYFMTDAGILMDHMMLEAAELGLGTVFIGMFDEDRIRDVLGVPEEYRIVGLTPLGVPEKMPKERPHNELADMVHYDKW